MQPKSKSHDPIDFRVGKRLRIKRELSGLSQSALGEKIGVSRIKVGQFEAGTKPIPASTLYKLTEIFKVNVSFFFGTDPNDANQENAIPYEPLLNKEAINLLKDFQNLDNPEVRKAFAEVMERTAQLSQKE